MSFLEVSVIRVHSKFTANVYRKPTFRGVYTHFDSTSPISYKIGMIYTLVNRCVLFSGMFYLVNIPPTVYTLKTDVSEK